MKLDRTPLFNTLGRLAVLVMCLASAAAQADRYGDVNQLVRAGKLTEAMTQADDHLAIQPNDPQMRFLKGVIERTTGQTSAAMATFTELTQRYPELPEPYNNLAVLYFEQNQLDKARAALEMALRTNPRYAAAHENLGDVYARLASDAYAQAQQLDSANTGVGAKLNLIGPLVKMGRQGLAPAVGPLTIP
jgi:tetratricopeptide (TPR) repeat protein